MKTYSFLLVITVLYHAIAIEPRQSFSSALYSTVPTSRRVIDHNIAIFHNRKILDFCACQKIVQICHMIETNGDNDFFISIALVFQKTISMSKIKFITSVITTIFGTFFYVYYHITTLIVTTFYQYHVSMKAIVEKIRLIAVYS